MATRTAMKMLVVHDEFGNIKSAAIAPHEPNLQARLRPQRGEFVTELEMENASLAELRRSPQEFCQNFRIDTVNARLLPRHR